MSTAAYPVQVYWKATNAAPTSTDLIENVNDCSFAPKRDMLDTTSFVASGATGAKTRIAGLKDVDLSVTADANMLPTSVQALLRSDCDSGTAGYLTVVFDPTQASGSKGWQVQCLVESYPIKAPVAGKLQVEYKLVAVADKVAY